MHPLTRPALVAAIGSLLAGSALACGGSTASAPLPPQGPGTTPGPAAPAAPPVIPAIGSAAQLEVATWNIEWFGDPGNGPGDDALQSSNVRAVLAGADVDIWGLQEVVSATQFRTLVTGLPGYRGVLANDAEVQDGARYYSDFNDAEQKVGLVFKSALASLVSARVILAERDYDFAGRPPVEFRLRITLGTSVDTMPIIVLHAKAGSDAASYARRLSAAAALKEWLDRNYPLRAVWVIGDFNDDVDVSITTAQPSPYAAFVQDVARWRFPTKQLSDARIASTVSFPDLIDHQLVSAVAGLRVIDRSVRAWRLDSLIPSYRTTTTDHYPVVVGYTPK